LPRVFADDKMSREGADPVADTVSRDPSWERREAGGPQALGTAPWAATPAGSPAELAASPKFL